MTDPSTSLEKRLRAARYRKAIQACEAVLDGIGVAGSERRFLALDDVEELWPRYVARLRDGGDSSERWPAERVDHVRRRIEELRVGTAGATVVWLTLVASEPIGVRVPADPLLAASLDYLVSPAADLMLTTPDAKDGLAVERNHLATGDEYEITTWGRFAR